MNCHLCDRPATDGCGLCGCYYCAEHGGKRSALYRRSALCNRCYEDLSIGVIFAGVIAVAIFALVCIAMQSSRVRSFLDY